MSDNEFLPQEGPKGFINVWKRIIIDPQGFYREMPSMGGFDKPLIFLGICAAIYLVLRILVAETMVHGPGDGFFFPRRARLRSGTGHSDARCPDAVSRRGRLRGNRQGLRIRRRLSGAGMDTVPRSPCLRLRLLSYFSRNRKGPQPGPDQGDFDGPGFDPGNVARADVRLGKKSSAVYILSRLENVLFGVRDREPAIASLVFELSLHLALSFYFFLASHA
jgi:hypothetical protein